MKKLNKKSFLIAAVALLLGGGAFTAQALSKTQAQESDLVRANVEALADDEVSAGYVSYKITSEGKGEPYWAADDKLCVENWTSVTCHGSGLDWCQSSSSRWVTCS